MKIPPLLNLYLCYVELTESCIKYYSFIIIKIFLCTHICILESNHRFRGTTKNIFLFMWDGEGGVVAFFHIINLI